MNMLSIFNHLSNTLDNIPWLETGLFILLYLYCFYMLYILIMGIYRAHLLNKLNRLQIVLCFPAVVLGWLVDVVCNLVIAPFIFLEVPQELLVTKRLERHIASNDTDEWRYQLSDYICSNLLDVFDPNGSHCK